MKTSFRDHALAKQQWLLKFTLLWALSSTLAVIVLSVTCGYALTHRQVHWLPVCTSGEFSVGERDYSAAYLQQMTQKVADLRLTFNPETIDSRYESLLLLTPISQQNAYRRVLDADIATVHEKNSSSAFYTEYVSVDVAHHQGRVSGLLHRTSHGLALTPKHKTYELQFSFASGQLNLESIKEIPDEK